MVLVRRAAALRRGIPDDGILDVWRRAAGTIKRALLALRAEGRLDRVKLLDLTNCTFDGHMYNVRRVMEECLAIKPDLIFLWDEAWSGFARFSPFLRPRTAMGAAADIEAWLRDPASHRRLRGAAARTRRQAIGRGAAEDAAGARSAARSGCGSTRRTRPTNRCRRFARAPCSWSRMSTSTPCEAQFHEAVFTHASTSPNQQLIASLDVARRQMELEGYGLVMNAIEIALKIRTAVNTHPLISKIFPGARRRWHDPGGIPPVRFQGLSRPGTSWGDVVEPMREDEFYLDPDAHDARLRHGGLRRDAIQGAAGEPIRHPAQQDVAQLACCCSRTSTILAATSPT